MNKKITKYSDKQLLEFKTLIEKKIIRAKANLKLLKSSYTNDKDNGTDDTAPTFKSFDEGSNTLSKEDNAVLASRQEKFIISLENALIRIKNKTYGICSKTGKLIPKKRLLLVPHTTSSIEAKQRQ